MGKQTIEYINSDLDSVIQSELPRPTDEDIKTLAEYHVAKMKGKDMLGQWTSFDVRYAYLQGVKDVRDGKITINK